MLTRNNREYVPGYYQKLLNDNFFDKSNIQNKMKKKTSINIDCLINSINYNILSRLRSSRKDAPTINLKFQIDNKIYKLLKENYGFTSRFKENNEFLLNYKIETTRCTNQKYYSIASQFEFRLFKGRKLKYRQLKGETNVVTREITSNPTLQISFFLTNFP